jgi:hypothetical protein
MPAKRLKPSNIILQTRAAFELCVDEIATLQLAIEAETAGYNARKSTEEKAFKTRQKKQAEKLQNKFVSAAMFMEHHRDDLLRDKQTGETKLSFFGFRKSPGIVKALNSKWSLAKVILALQAAKQTACLKFSVSLDKAAVKKIIPADELAKYGLRIDFPEEAWIEAKRAAQTPEKRISA